jgi:hypothetical protein
MMVVEYDDAEETLRRAAGAQGIMVPWVRHVERDTRTHDAGRVYVPPSTDKNSNSHHSNKNLEL